MFFKPKDFTRVLSPMSGKVIALSETEDPIFSGKVVGDGVAVIPGDGEVVAPISGGVSLIADGKHSYGITGFDGIEVLVHIGIDTVKLKGECFKPLVKVGQRVEAGQPICSVDIATIRERGYDATTPVVITSSSIDSIKRLVMRVGFCEAGKTECMKYILVKQ